MKTIRFVIGFLMLVNFTLSAQISPNRNTQTIKYKPPIQTNKIKMCLTNDFEELSAPNAVVSMKNKTWPVGSRITVSFLDNPSRSLKQKILDYAQEWEQYANINLAFIARKDGDIRIGFKEGGSWSKIGIMAKYVPSSKSTMNFGWFDNETSDSEIKRVVLHEFGHALGLKHEHQSPAADICWDWDEVIKYYKDKNDWSESRIRGNLEKLSDEDVGNYTAYDPKSIMHYRIPNEITTCDFEVKSNKKLSSIDKSGIRKLYPKGTSRSAILSTEFTYNWSKGWDYLEMYYQGYNKFLLLLKSTTGDVHIHKMNKNGSVGEKVYDKKWGSGWTNPIIYKRDRKKYLFLIKGKSGDVHISEIKYDGTVGGKTFGAKWTKGWTTAKIFKAESKNKYLFLLKKETGDVHINRVGINGKIGQKVFDKKWTSGWTTAEFFTMGKKVFLFLLKENTGDVHIHKLSYTGQIGPKIYDNKWSRGWTTAKFFDRNGQKMLLLLNKYTGAKEERYVTTNGTIGERTSFSGWKPGWSNALFYNVAPPYKNLLFLLNGGSGQAKIIEISHEN